MYVSFPLQLMKNNNTIFLNLMSLSHFKRDNNYSISEKIITLQYEASRFMRKRKIIYTYGINQYH